ncbi:MAG: dihydroorotate dehydrogenase electron transfer subunit [Eubacteriales bacterium]|nr:dihydroorotate dehydrogenase electron transfer subunit [Eubacteriales bacterium]
MAIQEIGTVASIQRLGEGLYALLLNAPGAAALAQCGQFVHIACGEGSLLRRPISICDYGAGRLRLVFQVKGEGTKWLAARQAGDEIDVLGPLGHGFELEALGDRPVFVGGGIGVPPMLACVKKAAGEGKAPRAILGFRNADAAILTDDFRKLCPTSVCTDDGSFGVHGFVTDALKERLSDATGVAACGPKPMLKAIAALAKAAGLPCQVSMEERMGCGIGACLVCACALKAETGETRYGHVCKDGPVFDAEEVEW